MDRLLSRHGVIVLLVISLLLAAVPPCGAEAGERVVLTLFWGEGCPHCEQEKMFLQKLQERQPGLAIRDYEVWRHRENKELYQQVLLSAGIKRGGVPVTVVGSSVILGFNEDAGREIEEVVARCAKEGCPDGAELIAKHPLTVATGRPLTLPLVGAVDPEKLSLPVFTLIIAGLDSFNPCAFFVLLFLLSLLVHARSRKRMLLIGGIFVLFSGLVYFLFMAAWLNVFLVIGRVAAVTLAGGVVALAIGAINVKDFFLFKQGVSLVIPDSAKPKLFERMRGLLRAESLVAMVGGAVVLAVTANAYELLCTAGFPMVYTRVLTLHQLSPAKYYQYLVLYNTVYVVPLAAIVAVLTITLGARKMTEWQGRQLKLLSGLMMCVLGAALIVAPAVLNNAAASGIMLAAVVGVSWLVIAVMKRVRPEITI
jgi:thiol-disulfide isomerase/thioredoxin